MPSSVPSAISPIVACPPEALLIQQRVGRPAHSHGRTIFSSRRRRPVGFEVPGVGCCEFIGDCAVRQRGASSDGERHADGGCWLPAAAIPTRDGSRSRRRGSMTTDGWISVGSQMFVIDGATCGRRPRHLQRRASRQGRVQHRKLQRWSTRASCSEPTDEGDALLHFSGVASPGVEERLQSLLHGARFFIAFALVGRSTGE